MTKKNQLIQLACCALSMGAVNEGVQAAPQKKEKPVECYGVNTCQGKNGCGVSNKQIELSQKVYKGQYAQAKAIDCAGFAECSAAKGVLAWVSKPEKECFESGGFVFESSESGQLQIRDKSGVKS